MSVKQKATRPPKKRRSPWLNIFLALGLVPLVSGLLIAVLTAVGVIFMGSGEAQATVGAVFFLLSLAWINLLQKKWRLSAGWGLPGLALVLLTMVKNEWLNYLAYGLMVVGAGFIIFEIVRTMRAQLTGVKK